MLLEAFDSNWIAPTGPENVEMNPIFKFCWPNAGAAMKAVAIRPASRERVIFFMDSS